VACTEVLDDGLLDWLKAHRIKLVPVTYKEVMAMGCNLLALGRDRVLSPKHSSRVNALLRAEGITVLEPELDLLAAGGGSIHCMTMPLRRDPV
jgi:N-dimethylarginine dimethylaminohydrolase